MRIKYLLYIFGFLSLFWLVPSRTLAVEANLYLFWGDGCPHCAKEELFLQGMKAKYSDLNIERFEVFNNKDNARLMLDVAKKLRANVGGVPFTVIGDQYFSGFDENFNAPDIEAKIKECTVNVCPDSVVGLINKEKPVEEPKQEKKERVHKILNLPIFGQIDTANFSLPILTAMIGVLDGFNPCAMWALIFLISLLIGMQNRKRMFILGSAFIVASAVVYFLFMVAWLNLVLFIGVISWVRILIGLVALAGALYSLKDFYKNKDAVCEVGDIQKKQRILEKLKNYVSAKSFWLALFGIIGLSFMVNLVELLCSAGFPAVYTQVLAMNNLPTWQYYSYILLYILFFMLDDLIIFFVAMFTLQTTGLTTKYTRFSRLIGGILMLVIGLLMIFKPELLMFG